MTVAERFWAKVDTSGECWEWTASRANRYGYGGFDIDGKTHLAHRVSWTLANGPIPDGMSVLHHCDNPKCVRPEHLFLGTQADNIADSIEKGRHYTPRNGYEKKTHCPHGHPYSGDNLILIAGKRHCRECKRESVRRWRQRKRGEG